MSKREDAGRWLEQSIADRKTIDVLMAGERYYMVCFLAQQTAEKALKAFLYAMGEEPVFSHSVAALCDRCAAWNPLYGDLKSRVKNLDQYYIQARYPNGVPDQVPADFFDRADAESAVDMAEQILSQVRSELGGQ